MLRNPPPLEKPQGERLTAADMVVAPDLTAAWFGCLVVRYIFRTGLGVVGIVACF